MNSYEKAKKWFAKKCAWSKNGNMPKDGESYLIWKTAINAYQAGYRAGRRGK